VSRATLARLARDDRGGALENLSSTTMSWYVLFSVFLMNVQLGQSHHQRDMVDHAASVAADTVTKTLCADAKDYGGVPEGQYAGARAAAVNQAVEPILGLVAPAGACHVTVKPKGAGAGGDPGAKEMDVEISCEIPCNVPLAAQVMCQGTPAHVSLDAKQKAVATGCDSGKGG
jgi:hypothetical protein